jgi:outer membrane protein OmpA-like peptidoglycan-associated protein
MTTQETSRETVTTTTTTTHYFWERRPAGALPWVIGGLGLLGLGLGHGLPVRHGIEDNLTTRAKAAIAEAGATGAEITFVGRDGTLKGSLPPGVDAQALVSTIEALDGVRVVKADFAGSAAAGGATTSSPSPAASVEVSPSAPAGEASPTAEASPSVASTSGAVAPSVTAVSKGGKVTLSGTVPSQAAMDALVASATGVYGAGNVVNTLSIDDGVSASGLTEFGTLVGSLGKGSAATAALDAGRLTLTGSVADAAAKAAAEAAATAVTGGDASKVTSQLTVGAGTGTGTGTQGGTGAQAQLNKLPQITFESGSTQLTPSGMRAVQQAAAILKANPTVRVRVEGHTDDVGDAAANLQLSTARAEHVRKTLHDLGIAHDRMSYIGYGESRPKLVNSSDANRAANRRVQFAVL